MENKIWKYTFTLLFLTLLMIVIAIFQFPDNNLHIIACNVGQGDAILITYGSTQILTDGGPDNKVLDCLGKYLPFWDKEIELVISTHPDFDHSTGLVGVLKNYKVDELVINPIDPGTQIYQALKKEVGGGGIPVVNPTVGTKLGLGLIYLDIESPEDQLFSKLSSSNPNDKLSRYSISKDTNLYSIVYKLSFKNFSGVFTGDMPPEVSDSLASSWQARSVDYIKIPHHGSSNGITDNFLKVSMPKVAVISVGKNSWGFPREDVLKMLQENNVKVYRTDQNGDVELITDGEKYWIK